MYRPPRGTPSHHCPCLADDLKFNWFPCQGRVSITICVARNVCEVSGAMVGVAEMVAHVFVCMIPVALSIP